MSDADLLSLHTQLKAHSAPPAFLAALARQTRTKARGVRWPLRRDALQSLGLDDWRRLVRQAKLTPDEARVAIEAICDARAACAAV